jgi:sulfoquinovose isomerase
MPTWLDSPTHLRWLDAHTRSLLDFGRRTADDRGSARWLTDDGSPDPHRPIHTWITARMTHAYSLGGLLGVPGATPIAEATLAGLLTRLHDDNHGGWFSSVDVEGHRAAGKTCYNHAFVLLAASSAVQAGLRGAEGLFAEAQNVFLDKFWRESDGLCVDTWDTSFTALDDYRGVNANMHAVEAMLSTASVSGDSAWITRSERICRFVADSARVHDWRIPEHYDASWRPDLELNRDQPRHQFKPFGATVGHGLEWARLMLHMEAAAGAANGWLLGAAENLFRRAVADGWSVEGAPGFVYTTNWDGSPVVCDRLHWVAAEAINTAAALYRRTGNAHYANWYRQWWDYADAHLIDHIHGSWRHQLDVAKQPYGHRLGGQAGSLPRAANHADPAPAAVPDDRDRHRRRTPGMTMRPRLLIVGEAVIDVVVHTDGSSAQHPGGSPANVALALGRLGHQPRLLTSIGHDTHGTAIRDWLSESKVDLDPHSWTAEATSTAIAHLDASGTARYDLHIEWNPRLPEPEPVDLVHIGSISATLEPGDRVVGQIVSRASQESALISYDPNIRTGLISDEQRTRAAVLALVGRSDLVKVSDEDLAWIAPDKAPDDAARALLRRGPAMLVVTRGRDGASAYTRDGASAYTRDGVITVAAAQTTVADTIGAGDTLMAALIAALIDAHVLTAADGATRDRRPPRDRIDTLTPQQIVKILRYAVHAAAITVSRAGANPPWSHELAS